MIPGAFNFRDIGPVEVPGGRLGAGRVFRSDLLHRTDAAAAHRVLDGLGVTLVIDLRTDSEREESGSLDSDGGREVVGVPVLADVWSWDDEHSAADEWFLRDRTIEMLEQRGRRLVEVFELMADADGAVVVHCTAGKDRTGVVSATLLGLLGASRDTVVTDYARSAEAMPAMVRWYREEGAISGPPTEAERVIIERAARPETMSAVVDHVDAAHGGFEGWARAYGWDRGVIDALRSSLVTPE